MAYKDKEKQREANRLAQAKFKAKGITEKVLPGQGITEPIVIPEVIPKEPEVIDGKYNPEYLPGGKYYKGCCYQDEHGNWTVRGGQPATCKVKADCPEVQAIWDRRTGQGQPDVYGAISAKTQSINPMMVGYVPEAQA